MHMSRILSLLEGGDRLAISHPDTTKVAERTRYFLVDHGGGAILGQPDVPVRPAPAGRCGAARPEVIHAIAEILRTAPSDPRDRLEVIHGLLLGEAADPQMTEDERRTVTTERLHCEAALAKRARR